MAFDFVVHFFSEQISYSDFHFAIRCFYMHMRALEICRSAFEFCMESARREDGSQTTLQTYARAWARAISSGLSRAKDSDQVVPTMDKWRELVELHHDRITQIAFSVIAREGPKIWTGNLEFDC